MRIRFKAKKEDGRELEGVREAPDRLALARQMREEGLLLLKAEELKEGGEKSWWQKDIFHLVKLKEKILLAGNLSTMISAGLSLSRSLEVISRQTSNKYFKAIIADLLAKVGAGQALSQALAAYPKIFPEVFVAMVGAGEESGNLAESLNIVRDQLTKTYELKRKVKGAMIYPAVIMILMAVIGILMMIFVVPTLVATFKDLNVQLPLATRFLIAISDLLVNHYLILAVLAVILAGSAVYGIRTMRGQRTLDWLLIKVPVIGTLTKKINSAMTMRTISSLISAGVSLVKTMTITEKVLQNSYFKKIIADSGERITKGVTLSEVFKGNEQYYPVVVGELTAVGEETGELPQMLLKGAQFFEEEVDQATKNLSTIIEPLLMILMGLAVGFFAISIIGPIYSLSSSM